MVSTLRADRVVDGGTVEAFVELEEVINRY